ncbi:unnamed protein product [Adineta ricciae]|uniref:Uncharacterized protein n=1 Tax=Adineta ricciae TaxID=249248 RepID=A0A815V3S3_ADIRI|nr:unnamed protein product [Adineta ricciae]
MPSRTQRTQKKSQETSSKSKQTSSKSRQHPSSKSQQLPSPKTTEENHVFAIVRDEDSDMLCVLPRNELVPIKKSLRIAIGDTVLYGPRADSVRGVVILIGSEEECNQSFDIIQRTKNSSTYNTNVKSNVQSMNHPSSDKQIDCNEMGDDIADDIDEFDSEDPGVKNKEDACLSEEENDKENSFTNTNVSPFPILTTAGRDVASNLNIESSITFKRKTPPVNESSSVSPKSKRQKSLGFVSMREHVNLVAQLAQVNEENMLLHSTWMPRPVDKQTIDYFIYVGKTLSNYVNEVSDDGDGSLDRGDILDYICTTLGMTEAELRACAGKTLLSTARQVIGKKYPGLSTTFADVAKEHVQAVADYACLMHPLEKKANDMPKIKKGMGNVFATRKHSQKMKIGLVSMDNSVANSDSDAST